MPIAEPSGVELHYRRVGAGEPLVLVHGSWVDSGVWGEVVPLLSHSFEVVAYDRRGHGGSSSVRPGSVGDDVDDLAALIESLELGPAHVAGTSFGGSIALRLTATAPELVRSVTVHEPPFFDLLSAEEPELAELRLHLTNVAARLESGDMEGGARLYFDEVAETPGGWDGLDQGRRELLLSNAPTYLDHCHDPEAFRIDREDLAAVASPVLVTHGDRRPPLFRRIVELVSAVMPGARSQAIPGAAHDPQVTHPGQYADLVESFSTVAVARP
jgi:pimeloyl-ACP methyl ester carboxylesterase